VERAFWSEDTIITSPLLGGDGRIRELIQAGLVSRVAGGYAIVGESAGTPPQPEEHGKEREPPKSEADPQAVHDAEIAKSIPGTSAEVDAGMLRLEESTSPSFIDGAVLSAARGGDLSQQIAEAASLSGQEPSAGKALVDQRIAEGARAAVAACERVGIPADQFDAFSDQLSDKARDEVVSELAGNRVGALLSEARAFVKAGKVSHGWSEQDLLSATYSDGVSARQINGVVVLDGVKGETITAAEAFRLGILPRKRR
jgi:hypothetical protein